MYSKTLDAGPMVTHWLTSGYEIPFTQLPPKFLSAKNNKSCTDNLVFAREELQYRRSLGSLYHFGHVKAVRGRFSRHHRPIRQARVGSASGTEIAVSSSSKEQSPEI